MISGHCRTTLVRMLSGHAFRSNLRSGLANTDADRDWINDATCLTHNAFETSGSGCSKLTTLLVNISLKFQTLISEICQYFLLKKCEKLLHCKSFSHFFNKKYQCIWLKSPKTLNKLTS